MPIAVIVVEPAVKYSFVLSSTQTRLGGQYNAELTLSPWLHVKPLITAIRAIQTKLVSMLALDTTFRTELIVTYKLQYAVLYLQSSAHLGGLVTFSRPHGKVSTVAPQKHFTST